MPEKKAKKKSGEQPVRIADPVLAEAGKFCLDIAKLVFGGVILAGLMKQDVDYVALLVVGLGVVILFTIFGFRFIRQSKQK